MSTDEKNFSIDLLINKRAAEARNTAEEISAAEWGLQAWDGKLNLYYGYLRNALDDEGNSALRAAQHRWLDFRDQESASEDGLIDRVYDLMGGTMTLPMRVYSRM